MNKVDLVVTEVITSLKFKEVNGIPTFSDSQLDDLIDQKAEVYSIPTVKLEKEVHKRINQMEPYQVWVGPGWDTVPELVRH